MSSEGEDSSYASSHDDDESTTTSSSSSGFIGVRALQPTTASLDRYRLRDYPLGSAFAFDVRPGGIAAKITLTAGARLHIASATIVEVDDDDDDDDDEEDNDESSDEEESKQSSSIKKAVLTINTPGDVTETPYPDDEDNGGPAADATMALWDYRAGDSRTITNLGLSISGPTSLSLGVKGRSSALRSINVFGSVVLDDQIVSYGLDDDDDYDEEDVDVGSDVDVYDAMMEEEDGEYFEEEKYWGVPLDEEERDLMRQLMEDERAELEKEAADNGDALMEGSGGDDDNDKNTKPKKRKMSVDKVEKNEEEAMPMSKKQRKKLAEKKAQELADAVAKEQGHDAKKAEDGEDGTSKKSKKKKKKNDKEKEKEEVPTKSLTRERRIEGGVIVRDIVIGVGQSVKPGRKVSINYEGSLASDGSVFDKNKSKTSPLNFRPGTGEVIKGLDKGMEGMKVGGERVITIPPAMGYGKKGNAMIPKNSTLVFTVKLLGVGGR